MVSGDERKLWELKTYQDAEEVEIFGGTGVVSTLVLELGISVECVQVLLTKLRQKYDSIDITDGEQKGETKSGPKSVLALYRAVVPKHEGNAD